MTCHAATTPPICQQDYSKRFSPFPPLTLSLSLSPSTPSLLALSSTPSTPSCRISSRRPMYHPAAPHLQPLPPLIACRYRKEHPSSTRWQGSAPASKTCSKRALALRQRTTWRLSTAASGDDAHALSSHHARIVHEVNSQP